MVHARDLKFHVHVQIPHEKNSWPVFFCVPVMPLFCYVTLKTKFENLVCKISQKVFELEPSYLVCLLGT